MITVCLLGANANISLWYRLLIIASVIIWATYNVFVYFHEQITQCDLLTDINSAISWQQQTTSLMEIQQISQIAAYAVVITMKVNQEIKRLVVYYDAVSALSFKQLMRHIRWRK
ncbi:MAG: hypothetical protein K2X04_09915 [Burkholderiales bacterium]|jgi:hypothetical protein|nr:hypothetical protein [Burkholderiales bacterium]